MCVLSHVRLFATPWTVAHEAPLSMEFSRQEYWSGVPFPTPGYLPDLGIRDRQIKMTMRYNYLLRLVKIIKVTIADNTKQLVQFSSVTQLCLTLCNPEDCSTPGLPVHHQLPELTQTHFHWVGDVIQPSASHKLLAGRQNCTATLYNISKVSHKIMHLPYDSVIPFLVMYLKEMKV